MAALKNSTDWRMVFDHSPIRRTFFSQCPYIQYSMLKSILRVFALKLFISMGVMGQNSSPKELPLKMQQQYIYPLRSLEDVDFKARLAERLNNNPIPKSITDSRPWIYCEYRRTIFA